MSFGKSMQICGIATSLELNNFIMDFENFPFYQRNSNDCTHSDFLAKGNHG
jgi:hypothetical protein